MKSICKRRNCLAVLLTISICLAVWLGLIFMLEAAFAFGAISLISLLLLLRQSRLLNDARLIWDNRILVVPSDLISMSGRQMRNDAEETVVSTFGILIGSEIYRWGLDGVHGVRLNAAQIDRAKMYLTFGDEEQNIWVELLHGMIERQAVLDAAQRLWQETGVKVRVSGW